MPTIFANLLRAKNIEQLCVIFIIIKPMLLNEENKLRVVKWLYQGHNSKKY